MKIVLRKATFICLLGVTQLITMAQNNPIFNGGSGDGQSKSIYLQSINSIYGGGSGDGQASVQSAPEMSDRIFNGGFGDGWTKLQTERGNADTIFAGGNNDGWSTLKTNRPGTDDLFSGGFGDGWFRIQTTRPFIDALFTGGEGDGWASTYRPQGPIPVHFMYFNARKSGENASLLTWKTAQEMNADYYEVQRSEDAVHFHSIGRVDATGNSSSAIEYFFTDYNPVTGYNYYRLRQVDLDGRYIFTPARLVQFDTKGTGVVKYYPNPTNGILFIDLPEHVQKESKVINISNAAGIVMNQFTLGETINQPVSIDLGKYPKSVYFIQVRSASINSTQRVILQ